MKNSSVHYDQENKIVKAVFHGFINYEKFRELGDSIFDYLKKNKAHKQLNDTSTLKVLTQDAQKYVKDEWFTNARRNGLKYLAFVVPGDVFGKVSMESANSDKESTSGVEIKYFESENKAISWLNSHD
ncbi:MAG: hypothetical protein N4A72_06205 [Bacteroidales bacterium]|jgi:hypothetical protein|nr:hypothetical protein [Bacteroidales bacterium]